MTPALRHAASGATTRWEVGANMTLNLLLIAAVAFAFALLLWAFAVLV